MKFYSKSGKLETKIRVGLPKGNLNKDEPNRGYTKMILNLAGYHIQGYEPGKETEMPVIRELEDNFEFYCMKPKQFPLLLQKGILNLAIFGKDNQLEYLCSKVSLTDGWDNPHYSYSCPRELFRIFINDNSELLSNFDRLVKNNGSLLSDKYDTIPELVNLGYGRVDVCWGSNKKLLFQRRPFDPHGCESNVQISSAYPNLTFMELGSHFTALGLAYFFDNSDNEKTFTLTTSPSSFLKRNPLKYPEICINSLASNTETMIKLGLCNFIVDSVSSGKSFERNELVQVGKPLVKDSTARVYSSNYIQNLLSSREFDGIDPHFDSDLCDNFLYRYDLKNTVIEFIDKLKQASIEYGKTRPDSLYYKQI